MRTIKHHYCPTCGKPWDSPEQATECEHSHKEPATIATLEYTRGEDYPEEITIKMNDGTIHIYQYIDVAR